MQTNDELRFHPKLGPSWEGFAIETIIRHFNAGEGECYFWSAYGRAELDLFVLQGAKRIGMEIKHTDAPKITRSLKTAINDLKIDQAFIVYPGRERFRLAPGIHAMGLETLIDEPHRD